MERHVARFALLNQTQNDSIQLTRGKDGGGFTVSNQQAVQAQNLTFFVEKDRLHLQPQAPNAFVEWVPQSLGLPASWLDHTHLRISYHNPSESPIRLRVKIQSLRGYWEEEHNLSAGKEGLVAMDIRELALISRGKAKVPPVSVRFTLLTPDSPDSELILNAIEVVHDPATPSALADDFGQRIKGNWDNKIQSVAQLQAQAETEKKSLSQTSKQAGRDRFGGWTEGPQFKATGFFRLEEGPRQNGITHWWLVDPLGNPFWSLGVTGVRPFYADSRSELTIYQGREELFSSLPSREGAFAEVYQEEMFSFYAWNLIRKWGSLDQWREMVPKRMDSWGLNTLGNWSDAGVLERSHLPYTRFLRSNGPGAVRLGDSRLVDVFDPSWPAYLDSAFAEIKAFQNDSLLLGYFVDNEQAWGRPDLLKKAHKSSALRQQWLKIVQNHYPLLPQLNQAWGTEFQDWQEVAEMSELPGENQAFAKIQQELETLYAETYFGQIKATLNRYDPNHLYLGCRFTKRVKPAHIVAAAGKYCDVITINNYSLVPEAERMEKWHRLSGGKPILIGEHHLPLQSERQLPPRYRNFTAEEREHYFQEYEKAWAQMPFSVGSHWYQWVDQPLTGRAADGENQTVGLVDIVDQPHPEMLRALTEISKNIYQWHSVTLP